MVITAFDFETCNYSPLSAVDLGIAVFELRNDWQLVETRSWRFSPIEDEFYATNSKVNGIQKCHVEGMPGFADRWPQIEPYFSDAQLVAHNLSFDMAVLCDHLDHLGIERPNATGCCTMGLAQRYMRHEPSFKLDDLCRSLRIPLQHHVSVSDTIAAGRIFTHLHSLHGATWNLDQVSVKDWTRQERSSNWGNAPNPFAVSVSISIDDLDCDDEVSTKADDCIAFFEDCDDPTLLDGWAFSITGDMVLAIDRSQFVQLLRKAGAKCGDRGQFFKGPAKGQGPTNSLLISEEELQDVLNGKNPTGKLRDAAALREKDKPIVVIPESDFYELILNTSGPIKRESYQEVSISKSIWNKVT